VAEREGSIGVKKIEFECSFTKQLYYEISAIQDMKSIDRPFMTLEYTWAVWQKVYKGNFGCTSYLLPSLQ
jgi:ribosome-associated toxin RatA of RatAB toxin-antitoxin module